MRLLVCLAVHALVAGVVPSPWAVPNLTLVGVVVCVTQSPRQWLLIASTAGLVVMAGSIRVPGPVFVSYLVVGAVLRRLIVRWDAADLRVQVLVTGIAAGLLVVSALWLEDLWSVPLMVRGLGHVALTVGSLVVVRRLLGQSAAPADGGP